MIGVQASAGPTLADTGYSVAAGAGFYPTSRIAFLFNFERTHVRSEVRTDRGVETAFRGGTLTLGTGELQVSILRRDRVGPYGLVGFAAGRSRHNVNARFPDPRTNDIRLVFYGAGIQVPLNERVSLFADARLMIGSETGELSAVAPLRGGIAWRF